MKFKTIRVELPKHDADVEIVFPGGKIVLVQARPSNADEGYNGSLDICLPDNTLVSNWHGDHMESAPPASDNPLGSHERIAKQLVIELPGNYDE